MVSEVRKESRRLTRTRTAALRHAAGGVQGIIFPSQAGQEVNLKCSKGDLDQKVKFPNSRHCETLEELAWGTY